MLIIVERNIFKKAIYFSVANSLKRGAGENLSFKKVFPREKES